MASVGIVASSVATCAVVRFNDLPPACFPAHNHVDASASLSITVSGEGATFVMHPCTREEPGSLCALWCGMNDLTAIFAD